MVICLSVEHGIPFFPELNNANITFYLVLYHSNDLYSPSVVAYVVNFVMFGSFPPYLNYYY